jgi:drug/metabolite transporter (DMT)-like permease
MNNIKKPFAILLLVAVTAVWGSGFTIVKLMLNAGLSAGMVNMFRGFGLAALILAVFWKRVIRMRLREAVTGIAAGMFNALGYILQSAGLMHTTPTTSAFLTVLNTVLVPLIAFVFYRTKPSLRLLPSVALAIVGTFFLTGMSFEHFALGKGEWLTLGCALCYAALIAFLGNTGKSVSAEITAFWMGLMQGLGAAAYFLIFERTGVYDIAWSDVVLPIVYIVVLGSFFTTTAQVVSQKALDASIAAMIMTLEAVFGTLISLLAGYDEFSWGLLTGGLLILAGVLLILLPTKTESLLSRKKTLPNSQKNIS